MEIYSFKCIYWKIRNTENKSHALSPKHLKSYRMSPKKQGKEADSTGDKGKHHKAEEGFKKVVL